MHPHTDPLLKLTRRVPIDFPSIAAESGLSRGKLCCSPAFGWGVQNTYGIDGPSFGCVTPPAMQSGETTVAIDGNDWCFYAPNNGSL